MEVRRRNLKSLLIASLLLINTQDIYAQVTASASASVTIVTPISMSLVDNMSFGNIAVSPSQAGTVVLDVTNGRSKTGAVTLPAMGGTISTANFLVSGAVGYTYAISLPSNCTITDGSGHNMTISNFTSSPSNTGVLTNGTSNLKVGATLNVPAAQPAGTYGNATGIEITVNYN